MPSQFKPTTENVLEEVRRLASRMDARFDRLEERLTGVEERLDRQGELLVVHTGLLTQIWKRLEIPEDDEAFQEVRRLHVAGDD